LKQATNLERLKSDATNFTHERFSLLPRCTVPKLLPERGGISARVLRLKRGLPKDNSLTSIPTRETVASIRHDVACRGDIWVRDLVLSLTLWFNLVCGAALLIAGIFPS